MARYRTNVALAIKGDRIARGKEIDLTDDQAARLDPADITLIDGAPAPKEEVIEVPLEEMTSAQLKARAKELGLSAAGSAADLRERIALAEGAPAPEEDEITSD